MFGLSMEENMHEQDEEEVQQRFKPVGDILDRLDVLDIGERHVTIIDSAVMPGGACGREDAVV